MDDAPLKTCTRCGQAKPLDSFYWQKSRHGRRYPRGQCKQCEYTAHRLRVAADPEAQRLRSRRMALQRKYGLTLEAFYDLLGRQGGGCAICTTPLTITGSHVDHDHRCCASSDGCCGTCVRGVLCQSCNTGLGKFGDDASLLLRAASYVQTGPDVTRREP